MTIDRRTLIKGAAWAVPVIAAAVAVPLAAASGEPDPKKSVIEFTNVTSNQAGSNEVGWNTKIKVVGPVSVTGVYLRVTLKRGGETLKTEEYHFSYIAGYGNSGEVRGAFTGLSKGDGSPFTVEFYASADNADYITGVGDPVTPHGGWS